MRYQKLLQSLWWAEKRLAILKRDSNKCQNCDNANIKERSIKPQIISLKRKKLPYQNPSNNYKITAKVADNPPFEFNFKTDLLLSHDLLKRYTFFIEFNEKKNNQTVINLFEEKVGDSIENHFVRGLQVHHKYYQEELLPWEYPDHALTTLCLICHEKLHANQKIEWLDKSGLKKGKMTCCKRCGGSGFFPEYIHIELGVCFRCHGAKYEELINQK